MANEEVSIAPQEVVRQNGTQSVDATSLPSTKPDTRPSFLSRLARSRLGRAGLLALGLSGGLGLPGSVQAKNMVDPYGVSPMDKVQSTDYVAPPNSIGGEGKNLILTPTATTTKTEPDSGAQPTPHIDNATPAPLASPTSVSNGPGVEAMRQQAEHLRQTQPDVYLSNNVPFSSSDFSIMYGSSKTAPNTHLSFVVVLNSADPNAAKGDAQQWLKSLNLTDEQIKNLDVVYLNPKQAQEVTQLKNQLPYLRGNNFGIEYNKTLDKTTVSIDSDQKDQGWQEMTTWLKNKGIDSVYWIPNLTIKYE